MDNNNKNSKFVNVKTIQALRQQQVFKIPLKVT